MIKKILYSFCLMMLILNTSCNKWLELKPQDGITREEFWKTKDDVKAAIFGAYSSLIGPPPGVGDRPLTEYMFLWGELRADMIVPTVTATVDERDITNMNIQSLNFVSQWASFYRTINYCNTVLDFAPQAKTLDPTFSDADYKAYLGEALAIRSWMYFYLARTFQEVPLKLTSTSKDSDIKELGGTSNTVVLAQIISDLKLAQTYVKESYGSTTSDKGRFTKAGVSALLADVYLWTEQYQNCSDECDKVINTGKFDYVTASSAWVNTVFYDGSSKETIFEINNKTVANNVFYNMLFAPAKRYTASSFLTSDIFPSNTDVDVDLSDIRGQGTFFTADYTIIKHSIVNPSYVNFQVYRYSDVKLMKAEALARIPGGGLEALQIVKDLREKRKALKATEQTVTDDDADGICEYILAERSREFAFEGKRWFDLLRNAKRDNYTTSLNGILEASISKTVSIEVQQSAISKIRDTNSHYLPIYENELFADLKLKQNPFYTK